MVDQGEGKAVTGDWPLVRARYSKGVITPLEKLEIDEGKELTVTISEVPEIVEGEDPLDLSFGGWVGSTDAEELKKNIYAG